MKAWHAFWGKVMVFGGDCRRVLPIGQKGNGRQTLDATLNRSYLWPLIRHLYLIKNMRVHRLQGTATVFGDRTAYCSFQAEQPV